MEKTLDLLTFSRLIRFFQSNTDGISSSLLKETYKYEYGKSFPYKTKTVVKSLLDANYVRIELDPFQSFEEILKPTNNLLEIIFDEENNIVRSKNPGKVEKARITRMEIPPKVKETGKCPVLISYILNPSKFWFQVKGKDHSDQIMRLVNEMTSFYLSEEGADFKLTDMERRTLRNPKLVAAPFFNKYYRALVLSRPTEEFNINVLYIDYGNTNSVNVSTLFRLRPEYCRLPCQAVLAREVNLSEKCSRLNMESICLIDKIDLHAHFVISFGKDDKFWPAEAVPVQLKNKDDVEIADLLQETLDL